MPSKNKLIIPTILRNFAPVSFTAGPFLSHGPSPVNTMRQDDLSCQILVQVFINRSTALNLFSLKMINCTFESRCLLAALTETLSRVGAELLGEKHC